MPNKNKIKKYLEDSFYHIYNRGVEKRDIFLCDQDYRCLLGLLKRCLSPNPGKNLTPHPLAKEIILTTYILMPNHFHLLVWQKNKDSITKFMRFISGGYATYFNEKYHRVGFLFQGVYRAVSIENEEQLIHSSRYIHINCQGIGKDFLKYPYSSLPNYLGKRKQDWVHPEIILDYFDYAKRKKSLPALYETFLGVKYHRPKILKGLILDEK